MDTFVHSRVLRIVARRVALAIPLLLAVSAVTFVLVSLTPGNPVAEILGPYSSPAARQALARTLALNLPVYEQYWRWLEHAVTGNVGISVVSGESVTSEIGQRIGVTLWLSVGSILASVVVGGALGIFSALRGGPLARAVDGVALLGFALPAYWVGAELIVLFAVDVHWFPATGYVSPSVSIAHWLRSLVLPVAALSLYGVAAIAKQTREAMLDALASEYIRMARANGIPRRSIVLRHALRNASINVVTVLGVIAVGLLGGTVLAETVFSLPGLGSLMVSSAEQHDLPVVQALAVLFTAMVVVINLVIDLAYVALNPRMSVG